MLRVLSDLQDTGYFIISFLTNLNVVYNTSLVIIKQRFVTQQTNGSATLSLSPLDLDMFSTSLSSVKLGKR